MKKDHAATVKVSSAFVGLDVGVRGCGPASLLMLAR